MADYRQFIGSLVRDEVPAASGAELDALLHWLAGRRNQDAAAVETAFDAHGASTDAARRHVLRYLDATLFRRHQDYYRLFSLSPDSSLSTIRARHKQLLQTFHPDRHSKDRDWFTNRTEQLNRAYAYLKSNHGRPRPAVEPPRAAPAAAAPRQARAAAPPRRRQSPSLAARKVRLRRRLQAYLGNPLRFERRLYIVLYSVPVILFLFVYLNLSDITGGIQANGGSPGGAESRVDSRRSDDAANADGTGRRNETGSPRPPESPRPGLNDSDADHRLRTLDAFSPRDGMPRETMPGRLLPAMPLLSSLNPDRLSPRPGKYRESGVDVAAGTRP